MKCDAISNIIILFAALRLTSCFSSSIFRYHFECFFLELKSFLIKKQGLWLSRNRTLVKTNNSTSWLVTFWYNHYSLATVHPFIYVHIGFWILTIAIRPNWNSYHNITNAPTSLHLSQIKRISDSHYFLLLFTNSTLQHVPVTKLHISASMQVSLLGASASRHRENL